MNKKRCNLLFISGIIVFLLTHYIFAGQRRLTNHRWYLGSIGDGAGKIYFLKHESGQNFDLYRMDENGSNIVRLTNDKPIELLRYEGGIDFSVDKKRIAVIKRSDTHDYIYTMNADGTDPKMIYSTTNFIDQLKISPDGNKIAFVECDPNVEYGSLYIINYDGSNARSLVIGLVQQPKLLTSNVAAYTISGTTHTKEQVDRWVSISFSPDSNQIVFVDKNGYLSKINIDGTGLTRITDFYDVYDPYWLKSNKIIFRQYEDIATINPDGSGFEIIYSTTAYIRGFSISPDETKFAVVIETYDENYIVIVSSTGTILKEISITNEIHSVSWVSNTKLVFTNFFVPKDIYTVNIDDPDPVLKNLTNNDLPGFNYIIDAKGNKIVYADYKHYYSMNIDGSNKILLQNLPTDDVGWITLSPDGSKLLYTLEVSETWYLYITDTEGSATPTKLDEHTGYLEWLQWSPDGKKIIYGKRCDLTYYTSYYIINPDGSGKKQISFPEFSDAVYNVRFSPDGSKIMFQTKILTGEWNYSYVLCKAPVDISTYTIVFSATVSYTFLDWKSNKVLLEKERNWETNEFYVMDSDGSNFRFVDEGGEYAKLSPDGTKIAYTGSRYTGLYVINTDGTGKVKISDKEILQFVWTEDSKKIVYVFLLRSPFFPKIYISNANGTDNFNLNPSVLFASSVLFAYDLYPVFGNKVVYLADGDIWVGDFVPELEPSYDIIVPKEEGEVKIVIPEGAGEKGTINPDSGKLVNIGFKGTQAGKYTLRIFTQFGEKIYEETKEITTEEGYFEWKPPKDLASGVYLVHIEGPGVKKFKKIAILR